MMKSYVVVVVAVVVVAVVVVDGLATNVFVDECANGISVVVTMMVMVVVVVLVVAAGVSSLVQKRLGSKRK